LRVFIFYICANGTNPRTVPQKDSFAVRCRSSLAHRYREDGTSLSTLLIEAPMERQTELAIVRRAYAKQTLAASGLGTYVSGEPVHLPRATSEGTLSWDRSERLFYPVVDHSSRGEHIVHVGAGSGYYSAIMARLAGPRGRVTATRCTQRLLRLPE
jgi:hypothetical protein